MFNITILDDNIIVAEQLSQLISTHHRADDFSIRSVSSASEIDDLESAGIQTHILFADIVLPNEPTGIEVVKNRFPEESGTQIIYISGYVEYALDVYETEHVYFLAKPIDPAKLHSAIDRALAKLEQGQRQKNIVKLNIGRQVKLIPTDSIRYAESNLRQITVHTDSQAHTAYMKLDEFQKQLPERFVRCHRSIVVNLAFVSGITGSTVTLRTGETLPISKKHSAETKTALMNYLA